MKKKRSPWKSRKLWMFIGTGLYYSGLTTMLLWFDKVSPEVWQTINALIVTVAFTAFVGANVGEHFANNKKGK